MTTTLEGVREILTQTRGIRGFDHTSIESAYVSAWSKNTVTVSVFADNDNDTDVVVTVLDNENEKVAEATFVGMPYAVVAAAVLNILEGE